MEWILELLSELWNQFRQFVSWVKGVIWYVYEGLRQIIEWVIKAFDSVINWVKSLIGNVIDWLLSRLHKLIAWLFGLVQKWIRWVYRNLSNYIRLVAEKLRLWILSELKRIYDRLKALSDELKEESKKMRKWVEGLLRKVWEEITGIKEEQKVHRKLIAGAYDYAEEEYRKSLTYTDLGFTWLVDVANTSLGDFLSLGEWYEKQPRASLLQAEHLGLVEDLFKNFDKLVGEAMDYILNGFVLPEFRQKE